MFRMKKQFVLFFLVSFFANNLFTNIELVELSNQDILNAKLVLEKAAKRERILKYAIIGVAAAGVGLTLFKIMPGINDYFKFKADRDKLTQNINNYAKLSDQVIKGSLG